MYIDGSTLCQLQGRCQSSSPNALKRCKMRCKTKEYCVSIEEWTWRKHFTALQCALLLVHRYCGDSLHSQLVPCWLSLLEGLHESPVLYVTRVSCVVGRKFETDCLYTAHRNHEYAVGWANRWSEVLARVDEMHVIDSTGLEKWWQLSHQWMALALGFDTLVD